MIPLEKQKSIAEVAKMLLPRSPTPQCTVVFDIDDTLITPEGLPYEYIIDLFRWCRQQNFRIAIITARPDVSEAHMFTRHQLGRVGIHLDSVDTMYFRPLHDMDVKACKEAARKDLWNKGYRVVMTVGNDDWDHGLYGGVPIFVR